MHVCISIYLSISISIDSRAESGTRQQGACKSKVSSSSASEQKHVTALHDGRKCGATSGINRTKEILSSLARRAWWEGLQHVYLMREPLIQSDVVS